MKRRSVTVSVAAVLVALTFILGWIPYGGPFLLPMLFAACCFGLGMSVFASLMFGCVSLVLSLMMPSSFVGWFFATYPWVPVVARLPIGPIAYFVHKFLKKVIKPKSRLTKILPISLTAAIGSALNTVFVGIFLLTLDKTNMPSGLAALGMAELLIFGSIEIAVNAILLPPIVMGVRRALPRLFKEVNSPKKSKDIATEKEINATIDIIEKINAINANDKIIKSEKTNNNEITESTQTATEKNL